ncbi:hypothetical protein [Azonexus sp.]
MSDTSLSSASPLDKADLTIGLNPGCPETAFTVGLAAKRSADPTKLRTGC